MCSRPQAKAGKAKASKGEEKPFEKKTEKGKAKAGASTNFPILCMNSK